MAREATHSGSAVSAAAWTQIVHAANAAVCMRALLGLSACRVLADLSSSRQCIHFVDAAECCIHQSSARCDCRGSRDSAAAERCSTVTRSSRSSSQCSSPSPSSGARGLVNGVRYRVTHIYQPRWWRGH